MKNGCPQSFASVAQSQMNVSYVPAVMSALWKSAVPFRRFHDAHVIIGMEPWSLAALNGFGSKDWKTPSSCHGWAKLRIENFLFAAASAAARAEGSQGMAVHDNPQ